MFRLLLDKIDERLPFAEKAGLSRVTWAKDFHHYSEGKIGRLMNLISRAPSRRLPRAPPASWSNISARPWRTCGRRTTATPISRRVSMLIDNALARPFSRWDVPLGEGNPLMVISRAWLPTKATKVFASTPTKSACRAATSCLKRCCRQSNVYRCHRRFLKT